MRRGAGFLAPAMWSLRRGSSLVILMYHRVLPGKHPDRRFQQPGMWVSPESLEMQLRILKRHFDIVSLEEWVQMANRGGPLPRRACSITFDDGWKDNFDYAFPLLESEKVSATIFLVSDLIGRCYEFWPNRLARLLHHLYEAGHPRWPPGIVALMRRSGQSRVKSSFESIEDLVDALIAHCKKSPESEILSLLDEAEAGLSTFRPKAERDLLNHAEIAQMEASGLISFGSHTRRHTRLIAGLSRSALIDEIAGSRAQLQTALRRDVSLFCYPNGDHTGEAVEIVRDNYVAAVTTRSGWVRHSVDDICMLPRVGIHEDVAADGRSFLARVGRIR